MGVIKTIQEHCFSHQEHPHHDSPCLLESAGYNKIYKSIARARAAECAGGVFGNRTQTICESGSYHTTLLLWAQPLNIRMVGAAQGYNTSCCHAFRVRANEFSCILHAGTMMERSILPYSLRSFKGVLKLHLDAMNESCIRTFVGRYLCSVPLGMLDAQRRTFILPERITNRVKKNRQLLKLVLDGQSVSFKSQG